MRSNCETDDYVVVQPFSMFAVGQEQQQQPQPTAAGLGAGGGGGAAADPEDCTVEIYLGRELSEALGESSGNRKSLFSCHEEAKKTTEGRGRAGVHLAHIFRDDHHLGDGPPILDLKQQKDEHVNEKPFACPFCSQKFTAPSSRATHIRSIHEKSQEFTCPECDKGFNQRSNMMKHYRTLHLASVVITCPECSRKFNQNSALRRHIKIVHIKELPHACSLCEKRFALAESLKKHTRAVHLKSRIFACLYCDYAASRADMLKIHVRKIHTKDWSYVCQFCEVAGTIWGCILPKELRRHIQSKHPDQVLSKPTGRVMTATARKNQQQQLDKLLTKNSDVVYVNCQEQHLPREEPMHKSGSIFLVKPQQEVAPPLSAQMPQHSLRPRQQYELRGQEDRQHSRQQQQPRQPHHQPQQKQGKPNLKVEKREEEGVESRALELVSRLQQPLEFSAHLEAEIRAKACRAPPSLLRSTLRQSSSPPHQQEHLQQQHHQQQLLVFPAGDSYDVSSNNNRGRSAGQPTSVLILGSEIGDVAVERAATSAAGLPAQTPSFRLYYAFSAKADDSGEAKAETKTELQLS